MRGEDGRWLYTARCGMRAKWPSERRTPVYKPRNSAVCDDPSFEFSKMFDILSTSISKRTKTKNIRNKNVLKKASFLDLFDIVLNLNLGHFFSQNPSLHTKTVHNYRLTTETVQSFLPSSETNFLDFNFILVFIKLALFLLWNVSFSHRKSIGPEKSNTSFLKDTHFY